MRRTCLAILLLLLGPAAMFAGGDPMARDWRTASREPAGLAPDPATTPEAVVQVYAARAYSWRGAFGVHSWIATKPGGASAYTVYEVVGWRRRWDDSVVSVQKSPPDRHWYGSRPELLQDLRGEGVDGVIARIDAAAQRYPYASQYRVYPGPNSNTFVAFVARAVPELRLDLPPTAIGKDYLGTRIFATAPSGTGYQFSIGGLFGLLAAVEEGVEINLAGLTFGVDPLDFALKLPGVGRLAWGADARAATPLATTVATD